MYAIITDGSISKIINHPKPLVIGDVQYPARIFSVWTASELAAIGIMKITFDNSNKKDENGILTQIKLLLMMQTLEQLLQLMVMLHLKHTQILMDTTRFDDGDLPDDKKLEIVKTRGLKYNLIQTLKHKLARNIK